MAENSFEQVAFPLVFLSALTAYLMSTGGWRRSGKSLAEVSSQSTKMVRSQCEYNVHFIGTCDNASTPVELLARHKKESTGDSLGQPKYAETAHPWTMDKQ